MLIFHTYFNSKVDYKNNVNDKAAIILRITCVPVLQAKTNHGKTTVNSSLS